MNLFDYKTKLPNETRKSDLVAAITNAGDIYADIFMEHRQTRSFLLKPMKTGASNSFGITHGTLKGVLGKYPLDYAMSNRSDIISNINFVEGLVGKLPDVINSETIDAKTLAVLAYVEGMLSSACWLHSYVLEGLKQHYIALLVKKPSTEEYVEDVQSLPSTIRKLSDDSAKFVVDVKMASTKSKDFEKQYNSIDPTFVTKATSDFTSANAGLKSHPVTKLSSGFIYNPSFIIGSYIVTWKAHSYKLVSDEKDQLELILLAIESENRENPSPQLKRKIVTLNTRIRDKRNLMKELYE